MKAPCSDCKLPTPLALMDRKGRCPKCSRAAGKAQIRDWLEGVSPTEGE